MDANQSKNQIRARKTNEIMKPCSISHAFSGRIKIESVECCKIKIGRIGILKRQRPVCTILCQLFKTAIGWYDTNVRVPFGIYSAMQYSR